MIRFVLSTWVSLGQRHVHYRLLSFHFEFTVLRGDKFLCEPKTRRYFENVVPAAFPVLTYFTFYCCMFVLSAYHSRHVDVRESCGFQGLDTGPQACVTSTFTQSHLAIITYII